MHHLALGLLKVAQFLGVTTEDDTMAMTLDQPETRKELEHDPLEHVFQLKDQRLALP